MDILTITLLTFVASLVGTVSGFGISTILVSTLVLALPLSTTLLLVAVIHLCNDVWKMTLFQSGANWKIILSFGVPGIFSSFVGAAIFLNLPTPLLVRTLGMFLAAYALFLFVKPSFRVSATIGSAMAGGAVSGFLAGLIGISGGLRAAFLSAFNLPKAVYLFTAGAIAFGIDITRIGTYLAGNIRIEQPLLAGLLLFIPSSFIGARLGEKIVTKIPQTHFRFVIAGFLLLVAIKLVIWPQ